MRRAWASVIVSVAIVCALAIWPPAHWQRADVTGLAQAVALIFAASTALIIATADRRRADQAKTEERAAFVRRRDYDEAVRLLALIEQDKQQFAANGASRPRSVEATATVLTTWPRRNWWGTAVDYYVESLRDPNNRYATGALPSDLFTTMQNEVIGAIGMLDFQDRN
jgi:hypothetical protein